MSSEMRQPLESKELKPRMGSFCKSRENSLASVDSMGFLEALFSFGDKGKKKNQHQFRTRKVPKLLGLHPLLHPKQTVMQI